MAQPYQIYQRPFSDAFKGKRANLVGMLDVSHGLLNTLLDYEVLTTQQVQHCRSMRAEHEKANKLLEILEKRDDRLFPEFCRALVDCSQGHVVEQFFLQDGQQTGSPLQYTMPAANNLHQENSRARVPAAAAAAGVSTRDYVRFRQSGALQRVSQDILPQEVNKIPFSQLTELKAIAEGGFGVVYIAKHRDWGTVAYKELKTSVIKETDKIARELLREAKMQVLRHPNIVAMYAVTFEPSHYGVVFEYISFGGLDKFVETYVVEWMMKLSIAHGTIRGLNYLHTKEPPVIHADLKAQNVLIDEGFVPKICDFGLSKWRQFSTTRTNSSSQRGTVTHIPPENWRDINCSRTVKFDIYGFGILLWELLAEDVPFINAGGNAGLIQTAVMAGQRPDLESIKKDDGEGQVADEVYQFGRTCIEECWNQNPDSRPTFADLDSRFEAFLTVHEAEVQKSRDNLNIEIQTHVDDTDDGATR